LIREIEPGLERTRQRGPKISASEWRGLKASRLDVLPLSLVLSTDKRGTPRIFGAETTKTN
jgi:hypothetical protein